MIAEPKIRTIAFVGDYLPRQCGIATYTHDLRLALATQYPESECWVVAVDDGLGPYNYSSDVRFQIPEGDIEAYRRAAEFLNYNNVDVVCLQHEFGIYGGAAGSHLLAMLQDLRMPVITTLHTLLETPTADQRRVMERLARYSSRVVVMTEKGRSILRETYRVSKEKIDVIPHGIPDMPFVDPNFYKDQFGVEGKNVLLTFGLLAPNKGIEYVLRALPLIVRDFPETVYIVLGATHPNLVREHGESYRHSLKRLTHDLNIRKNVVFYNRFVELDELLAFLGATDIYVTPYLNESQITSGTLAYSFGCGKAVVSTPYWHAEELLAEERGVLVPFGNSQAIADEIRGLLADERRRHAMRKRAYLLGRESIWSNVAQRFHQSFETARREYCREPQPRLSIRSLEERALELPTLRPEHLLSLTDSTGVLQHAVYTFGNFREGYCTDDNARALILTVRLEELGQSSPAMARAANVYAAFLNYAFDHQTQSWRNFMSYDRRWMEDRGSEDSLGRLVHSLGTCVGRSKRSDLQSWAMQMFEAAILPIRNTTWPRTWAFGLLGVHEYLQRFEGDRLVHQVREELTGRLVDLYLQNATKQWPWFERELTYANASLAHSLIAAGSYGENTALEIGLRSLHWLCEIQLSPGGCFRPIGSNGFYPAEGDRAIFDQQPIEAGTTVSACLEAYRITEDAKWYDWARLAFEWFLGRNDVGLSLYDPRTGGCFDGLQEDRVNQNQGAESTLAWLTAIAEMKLLNQSMAIDDRRPLDQAAPLLLTQVPHFETASPNRIS